MSSPFEEWYHCPPDAKEGTQLLIVHGGRAYTKTAERGDLGASFRISLDGDGFAIAGPLNWVRVDPLPQGQWQPEPTTIDQLAKAVAGLEAQVANLIEERRR